MKVEAEQVLCRFYLSSLVRHGHEPLYQWIVETCRKDGLQGATVLEGTMGLSSDGALLTEKAWALRQERPMIVEVVEGPRHVEQLLAQAEPVLTRGLVTLERAHVVLYRARGERGEEAHPPSDVIASQESSAAWEVKTMKLPEKGVLLRIFMGESDREPGGARPLYEAIVLRARESHMAGATVLKGPIGFGRHSRVHTAKLLELSTDLPVVIEIVDSEEQIQSFLPVVDALVQEGLVTLEAVRILKYASPAGS